MPFARPSLTEIIERVISDISNRMTGVESAVLRRSLLGILATAEAGVAHLLYGYIDWVAKQAMPDTADTEYLERWAAIWNIQRKQPEFGTGQMIFTAAAGAVITAGTIIQRQDAVQYTVLADAAVVGTTITVSVRAVLAGKDANLITGERVSLLSPVAGVQASGTVAAPGVTGGTESESDDRLRERLLERIQNPPQGGAAADYKQWALQVAGVTRAWVYPRQMGLGTVTVLFVTDDDPDSIIPGPAKVAEVKEHIELLRPVTAEVFVAAPIEAPLDMQIAIFPNTPTVRAAVTAELKDFMTRDSEPNKTTLISKLREAVSIAAGEENNEFISPTADVPHAAGNFATLGEITFSTLAG